MTVLESSYYTLVLIPRDIF